jgi:hypothetical protein
MLTTIQRFEASVTMDKTRWALDNISVFPFFLFELISGQTQAPSFWGGTETEQYLDLRITM